MKYVEMLAFSGFLNKTQGTDSPEWKAAMRKVNELMEVMGPYQLATSDGTYRPITPEAYARIEATFDEAVAAVSEFAKTEPESPEDEVRLQLLKTSTRSSSPSPTSNTKTSNPILAKAYATPWRISVTKTSKSPAINCGG